MIGPLILLGILGMGEKVTAIAPTDENTSNPKVEVVFVLDTTGSMGGLIEGAKKKIWSIANQIALGKPTPELKIGLVGYRDKGDDYVTKIFPLTDNLDTVYGDLGTFTANGGGDGPENVRQALHDALGKLEWSGDGQTLKIIFLVGDFPPHMDYDDVPTVAELCETAAKSDIIINTVRCGDNVETGRIWQEIALKAEGKFLTIDQTGGVVTVPTPFDKDLGTISDELGKKIIPYGDARERGEELKRQAKAEEMEGGSKADRIGALSRFGRMSTIDLVQAVVQKKVNLEEIKDDLLPEAMREMTLGERRAHIDGLAREQEELRQKVLELSKKRDAFIRKEIEKQGAEDAFDEAVKEVLREQAKKKGIRFGEE